MRGFSFVRNKKIHILVELFVMSLHTMFESEYLRGCFLCLFVEVFVVVLFFGFFL